MAREESIIDQPAWTITLNALGMVGITFVTYLVLSLFWGDYVLLDFSDLVGRGTDVAPGLAAVWPLFAWGAGATLVIGLLRIKRYRSHHPAETFFIGGWASLNAGIAEELTFRCLTFFSAMIVLPFFNFITFGLVRWVYDTLLVPLANWATLGALEPQLLGNANWVLGAAIVLTAGWFRNGHKYLGLLGYVNSWFVGMVMFWLVFNYGLATAITAHVLYDLAVFTTLALVQCAQPASVFERY